MRRGAATAARPGFDLRLDDATDVHSLLDLVAYGLGVALVPQSFAAKTDRVRFIGLVGSVPTWETVSVTSDPTSAAATALLRAVHEAKGGGRSPAIAESGPPHD